MPRKEKSPATQQVDHVEFIGLLKKSLATRLSIAQCFTFVSGAAILLSTVMVLTDHYNGTNYHKDKSKLASFKNMFYFFCAIAFAYQYQRAAHNKLLKVAKQIKPVLQSFNQKGAANISNEVTEGSAARELRLLISNPKQAYCYSNKELGRLASEFNSIENEHVNYLFFFLTYCSWCLETLSFFAELLQSVYRRLMLVQIGQLCIQFDEMFKKVPFIFSDQLTGVCEEVKSHVSGHSILDENDQVKIVENIVKVVNDRIAGFTPGDDSNRYALEYFVHDIQVINNIMQTMQNSLIMQFFYYGQMVLGQANNFYVHAKNGLFTYLGSLRNVINVFILISSILPLFALVNQLPMVFSSLLNSLNRRLINGCQLISFNVSSERSLFFIHKTYDDAKVAFILLEYLGCYISRLPVRYRNRKKLYFLLPNENPVVVWQRVKQLASLDLKRVISFVKDKDSIITVLRKALDLNDQVGIDLYFDLSINRIICKLNFSMFSVVEAEQQIARIESHWIFKNNELFDAPVSTSPLLSWGIKTMNINSLNNFIGKNKPRNSHEGGRGPKSDHSRLTTEPVRNVRVRLPAAKKKAEKKIELFRAANANRVPCQTEHQLDNSPDSAELRFIIGSNTGDPITYVCNRDAIAIFFHDSRYRESHIESCFNLLQHVAFRTIKGCGKQIVGDHESHKGTDLVPDNPVYTARAVKIKWRSGQRVVFRQSREYLNQWYATCFYAKSRSGVSRCEYPELNDVPRTLAAQM